VRAVGLTVAQAAGLWPRLEELRAAKAPSRSPPRDGALKVEVVPSISEDYARAALQEQLGSLKNVLEQRASDERHTVESLSAKLIEAEAELAVSNARADELQQTCEEFEAGFLELSVEHARLAEHMSLSDATSSEPPTVTELTSAVRDGDSVLLRNLLSRGASPDSTDAQGCTALWWAARVGDVACAQVLLAAAADVDRPDEDACTPLMAAAIAGASDVATLLLQAGANQAATKYRMPKELQDTIFAETLGDEYTSALWLATQLGHDDLVAILQTAANERGHDHEDSVEEAEPPDPQQLELPGKAERDALFRRVDNNGNGKLSLAEIDKAVGELWPHFQHKPALMRAYKAADVNDDGWIRRREFRLLLEYLVYFNNLWDKFSEIDTSGDRRLTADEFQHGCNVIGEQLSPSEANAQFSAMDANSGGFILFDEFCAWCARRQASGDGPSSTRPESKTPRSKRDLTANMSPAARLASERLHQSMNTSATSRSVRRPKPAQAAPMSPRQRARQKPPPKSLARTPSFGQATRQSRDHMYRSRALMETVIATKTDQLGPSHAETLKSKQSLVVLLEGMSAWDGKSSCYSAREPAASLATLLGELGRTKEAKKVRKRLTQHDASAGSASTSGVSSVPPSSPRPVAAGAAVSKWQKAVRATGQAAVSVKRIEEGRVAQKVVTAKEVEAITARLLSTQKLGGNEAWRREKEVMHGTHFGTVDREVAPGRVMSPVRLTKKQAIKKSADRHDRHRAKLERHKERREQLEQGQAAKVLAAKQGMSPRSREIVAAKGKGEDGTTQSVSERLYASGSSSGRAREQRMLEQSATEADLRRSMSPEMSTRSRQMTEKLSDDPGDAFDRLFTAATKTMQRQNEHDAVRKQQESLNSSTLHLSAAEVPAAF
jgi:ankyrin repeat protein